MKKVIVAAYNPDNRVIENHGKINRYFSENKRGFRDSRAYHPVIMGGKTFRLLMENSGTQIPGRPNIIVSDHMKEWYQPPREELGIAPTLEEGKIMLREWSTKRLIAPLGIAVRRTIEEALEVAETISDKVFIAGGQTFYDIMMPHADRLEITEIHKPVQGDRVFPDINPAEWQEVYRELKNGHSFVTYVRKRELLGVG